MSLLAYKNRNGPKIELKSEECIDTVLQPLTDHVIIKINGSLTNEDIFRTVLDIAVNRNSVLCHNTISGYCVQNVSTIPSYETKHGRTDQIG
jgi:hypothetical protein